MSCARVLVAIILVAVAGCAGPAPGTPSPGTTPASQTARPEATTTTGATPTTGPTAANTGSASPTPSTLPTVPASDAPAPEWKTVEIGDLVIQDAAEGDGLVVLVGNTSEVLGGVGGDAPHYWLDPPTNYRAKIMTSADGTSWEAADLSLLDLPPGTLLSRVVAGPGGFVASGMVAHFDLAAAKDVPTPVLLHSADGRVWERLETPADCAYVTSFATGDFGYVALGDNCRNRLEDHHRPGFTTRDHHLPVHLLFSNDGVTWTSTTDTPWRDFIGTDYWPWELATDGHTLVTYAAQGTHSWHSLDGGKSWTESPPVFNTSGSLFGLTYGNGRFVAGGTRNGPLGYTLRTNTCTSPTGEAWTCAEGTLVGNVTGLPTGFAGFYSATTTAPHVEMRIVTSTDGLGWRLSREPTLADLNPKGALWTSRGLLLWGSTPLDLPGGYRGFLRVLHGELAINGPASTAAPTAIPARTPSPGFAPIPLSTLFDGTHPEPAAEAVTALISAAVSAADPNSYDSSLTGELLLSTWQQCQDDTTTGTSCGSAISALWYLYKWSGDVAYFNAAAAVYDHASNNLSDDFLTLLRFNLRNVE